jgi:hypothetical protein
VGVNRCHNLWLQMNGDEYGQYFAEYELRDLCSYMRLE